MCVPYSAETVNASPSVELWDDQDKLELNIVVKSASKKRASISTQTAHAARFPRTGPHAPINKRCKTIFESALNSGLTATIVSNLKSFLVY